MGRTMASFNNYTSGNTDGHLQTEAFISQGFDEPNDGLTEEERYMVNFNK